MLWTKLTFVSSHVSVTLTLGEEEVVRKHALVSLKSATVVIRTMVRLFKSTVLIHLSSGFAAKYNQALLVTTTVADEARRPSKEMLLLFQEIRTVKAKRKKKN